MPPIVRVSTRGSYATTNPIEDDVASQANVS